MFRNCIVVSIAKGAAFGPILLLSKIVESDKVNFYLMPRASCLMPSPILDN